MVARALLSCAAMRASLRSTPAARATAVLVAAA